jgi:hypothetical protein
MISIHISKDNNQNQIEKKGRERSVLLREIVTGV